MKPFKSPQLKKSLVILLIFVFVFNICFINVMSNKNEFNLPIISINNNLSYDLLIISPERFSSYLKPLVDHKNNYGVQTRLVTTDEVYDEMFWKGRDDAEKIKYFIKKALDEWKIKYVLLVGGKKDQSAKDSWWIPARYTYLMRYYDDFLEGKFLTDLYFADIYDSEGNFSSWDSNNNGIFGEWPLDQGAVDRPNLYPNVSVGRIPCRNIFEVRNMVKKIISYETGFFSDSWFKKMLLVGGDTYPIKTDYYDGEVYNQQAFDMMPSEFAAVKIWGSEGTLKGSKSIIKALNNGCGFVYFSGHGGPNKWGTHPPDDIENWVEFPRWKTVFLLNFNKLPVCIAGSGCFINMFNVSLAKTDWAYLRGTKVNIPHCWSWSLVRKRIGGCISVIGSSALSYESPDIASKRGGCEWLDIHFFEQYGKYDVDILGECYSNTIISFLQNHPINWDDNTNNGDALIVKNVEQWLLFGDPSLKIGGYNN